MSSAPGMRAEPDLTLYHRPNHRHLPFVFFHDGAGPEHCRFVCGFFGCDARPFNPLLESLPRLFHAQMSAAGQSWLVNMLRVAAEETELGDAGSETMLAKLAEVMFVEVIRKHIARLPEDSRGWLSALRDRHIGQAMRLIHGQPARQWTLDALAHEVGLSRSVFAERFAHYVGLAPMHYLARWRMQLAARRLEVPGISIAQVAAEVGYMNPKPPSTAASRNMSARRPGRGARDEVPPPRSAWTPCSRHSKRAPRPARRALLPSRNRVFRTKLSGSDIGMRPCF